MKFKDLPGFPKLFVDYVDQTGPAQLFYPCPPGLQSMQKHATELKQRSFPREGVCEVLEEQAARFKSGSGSWESIQQLRKADTVAVVTGLEAGLFGGPLETLLKCLTTIKLAISLRREGISAVPIACLSSARHDFDGAKYVRLLDREGEVQLLSLEPQAQSRSGLTDKPSIERLVMQIEKILENPAAAADALQLTRAAYESEDDLFTGFARFISKLTEDWGLVLLDPEIARVKNLGLPVLGRLLSEASIFEKMLDEQAQRLREAGYSAPVQASEEDTHLRPVFLGCLLPAVAYIADPTEMTDFAMILPVYQSLHSQPLIVWPRVSATLMDSRSRKILEKYGRDLKDLFAGRDFVLKEISEEKLAPGAVARLDAISQEVESRLASLGLALPPEDEGLGNVIQTSRTRMLYQIGKLKERLLASQTLRREAMARQVERVCRHLAPEGHLQERHLGGLHFLLRYSREILRVIFDRIDPWKMEHQIISVD